MGLAEKNIFSKFKKIENLETFYFRNKKILLFIILIIFYFVILQ